MSSTIDSKNNHRIFSKPVFIISFSTLLAFTLSIIWLNSNGAGHVRADLKYLLSDELICINPPAPGAKVDAIYVLGGSQRSLELKYKTAADLFHKGVCKRIWILSRPGKTEFIKPWYRTIIFYYWHKFIIFGKI